MFKKMLLGCVACATAVLGLATSSFAVLTAEQLAVTGAIDTMMTDMIAWGWGAILVIAGFVISVKVFKKVLGKSTS